MQHEKTIHLNSKIKTLKKMFYFVFKLIITIVILVYLLSLVPLNEYRHVLMLLSIKSVISILMLVIGQVFLLASRWYLLAKYQGSTLSISGAIYGILMSFFFSQGLPASIGGDAFRLWWHRREGIATDSALKIIFFDRIYGLFSLVILCLMSLILLVNLLGIHSYFISLSIVVVVIGGGLVLLFMPWQLGLSARFNLYSYCIIPKIRPILHWIIGIRDTLRKQSIAVTTALLMLSMVTHTLVVTQIYVIGHCFSPEKINMLLCFAAVPPALLVSYMPFSIAGWGVREASMVIAFGFFGIAASIAILVSLTIGMSVFAISLLGGTLWIMGGFRAAYRNRLNDHLI